MVDFCDGVVQIISKREKERKLVGRAIELIFPLSMNGGGKEG